VMQFRFQGEALRLRRRIEVPIGGNVVRIRDEVTNLAAGPTPQASLYHFNLGYPAITPGSVVHLGATKLFEVTALPHPDDRTESVSFPAGDAARAVCTLSTPATADRGDLSIAFTFGTATLPHLQLWHDFRSYAGVLGIEPCTSARTGGVERIMQPGEARHFELDVAFDPIRHSFDK